MVYFVVVTHSVEKYRYVCAHAISPGVADAVKQAFPEKSGAEIFMAMDTQDVPGLGKKMTPRELANYF